MYYNITACINIQNVQTKAMYFVFYNVCRTVITWCRMDASGSKMGLGLQWKGMESGRQIINSNQDGKSLTSLVIVYLLMKAMSIFSLPLGKYCCLTTCMRARRGPSTSFTGLNLLSSLWVVRRRDTVKFLAINIDSRVLSKGDVSHNTVSWPSWSA